ncbi:3-hydroxyacyl-CoA dehydrogenase [Caenispirillum salinarum AK4]|uniref:3-hydroxyacyl-CoA dehydrogenase n=1 Tax=Caenispirillum salinarum AK4 TaxID=1238182 RepID=K9GT89_9PROT|nr:3-hydroxyacyl-CoA dehydrogenase NAD-binding domain-containing protein [Caenispirillum salinarum]EKV29175.1 3-hydroxyacyl-CoA dehydrogenase [Caenispirillum salinarum AK4]
MATIAVVGAGLIGASWTALLTWKGYDVAVYDPSPTASGRLDAVTAKAWSALRQIEGAPATPGARRLCATVAEAVDGADLVIEAGPEALEAKQALIAEIDAACAEEVPIASSTTAHKPSDLQKGARRNPARVIVAHPFNPPHLIPLVEIVPSPATAPDVTDRVRAFFDGIGKTTILVKREATGHIANRLAAALYREAVHLVAEGIASVEDVDKAVTAGPGLRWSVMGPHMLYHLGGGAGGYRGYLDHLGPAQERRWADLGAPSLTPEVKDALVDGVRAEADGRTLSELENERDAALIALLKARG